MPFLPYHFTLWRSFHPSENGGSSDWLKVRQKEPEPRNRMRKIFTSGSVGGAPCNRCFYPELGQPKAAPFVPCNHSILTIGFQAWSKTSGSKTLGPGPHSWQNLIASEEWRPYTTQYRNRHVFYLAGNPPWRQNRALPQISRRHTQTFF